MCYMFERKIKIEVYVIFALTLAFVGISHNLLAKEYGRAGCGAGATSSGASGMGMGQTSVATWNGIGVFPVFLDSQTMGISSGTSVCDASSSSANYKQKKERFVALNYSFLQTEMAAGQGENLRALSQLMGCQDIQSFSEMSKGNYDYFFSVPQSEPKKFIHRINEKIQTNPKLVSTCKIGA